VYITSSLDQSIKIWKPNFTSSQVIFKSPNFITQFELNKNLNPLCIAVCSSEGQFQIKNLATNEGRRNVFQWQSQSFIRKVHWSLSGLKLGLLDAQNNLYYVLPNRTHI
jgi:hypothetical protein